MRPHDPKPRRGWHSRDGQPGRAGTIPVPGFVCIGMAVVALLPGIWSWHRDSPAPGQSASVRTMASRPVAGGQYHDIGTVYRLLPDDTEGTPHQRFLVRTTRKRSLLIAHNTRIAPRIPDLEVGDTVEFCGDYVPNDKGGVVHWTHADPSGRHPDGWLLHEGRYYD